MQRATLDGFNCSMLTLGREAAGLSQQSFVKLLNEHLKENPMTQSRLSRLEAGLVSIEPEVLDAVCQTVGLTREFFFEPARIYPFGEAFYRKAKGTPKTTMRQFMAALNIDRIRINKLLQAVDFETSEIPYRKIGRPGEKSTAADIARTTRQAWKLPRGPIENLTSILEAAGIIIVPCDSATRKFSGVGVASETGAHVVFLNRQMPTDRQRFTLSHELGHIVMHRFPDESDETEIQADEFAAEFLMPEHDIRDSLFRMSLERAADLKRIWRVSMGSIVMRAQQLRCISPNQARYLWMKMSQLGYKAEEPIVLEPEHPTLLREIVGLHQSQLGYSEEELQKMLYVDETEFARFGGRPRPRLRLAHHRTEGEAQ